uniref:Uncharacterized protein n=1 Tax=Arundo donax TaxID=35708 RepID=A0A0A8ZSH9_ARUDO
MLKYTDLQTMYSDLSK